MKVDFFRHALTAADVDAVRDVVAGPMLTSGARGKAVEEQLEQFFGTREALLVNSWTNGAVAALLALGFGPGDEAIVPAMTFIATANVAELLGGKAVFVDVDPDTLLVTPEAVRRALTPRTRVVMPVHLYGQMIDVAALRATLADAGRADVAILEDAAHCFEGTFRGEPPGTHSDLAIFSFYATKNVTCGEGGAIVTNRPELAERLRKTRLHGMSAGAADRFKAGAYRHWDMDCMGVKANLPDLLAALLPAQIDTIRARLPARHALATRYREAFAGTGVRLPVVAAGAVSAEHIFPIHVPPAARDEAIRRLNEREVSVAVNYRSVPTRTYYQDRYGYRPEDHPISDAWGAGTLTLPLFPGMTDDEQAWVIRSVREAVVPLCG